MTNKRKIIVISGPTASGKTGLGVKLAKEFNGEIISADSRQVFRGLTLGTGKEGTPCRKLSIINNQLPNNYQLENNQLNGNCKLEIEDLRRNLRCVDGIPQWMIDIVEPAVRGSDEPSGSQRGEDFSLFDYLGLARLVIEDIFSRGKVPIIVGGTGLYVQGLVEGFQVEQILNFKFSIFNQLSISNSKNPKSENLECRLGDTGKIYARAELEEKDLIELNDILRGIDEKVCQNIDKNNPRRLIRAIERAQSGERQIKIKPDFEVLQIALDLPREELYKRIDQRVDRRFEQGMLEETKRLLSQSGVHSEWLVSLGLEYRITTEFLQEMAQLFHCHIVDLPLKNNIAIQQYNNEFAKMAQVLKFKIHQYARRQLIWLRRFPEIVWVKDYKEAEKIAGDFLVKN